MRRPVFLSLQLDMVRSNYIATASTQILYFTRMGLLLFSCYYHDFGNRESYIPSMKLFSSFKENFKLFNSLIMGRSFKSLPYFSRFSFSQRWRFWIIRTNVSQGIESEITCTKVLGASPNIFYDLQPCDTR